MKGVSDYEMKGEGDIIGYMFPEKYYDGFNGAAQEYNCGFGEPERAYQFCPVKEKDSANIGDDAANRFKSS